MSAPTAFIDADILLHRAVSFVDDEFDGEVISLPLNALHYFNLLLTKWMDEIGPVSDYFLVVSVGRNFRKKLYEEYKANRKDIVPHPAFAGLKALVMEYDACVWEEGIEADDLIGIRCTEDPNTVAVSADKDFATVPCTLIIPTSHGRSKPIVQSFTEAEADRNWLRQAMTGDTVDNYKGIPGIGKVKAEKILPDALPFDLMWGRVSHAFTSRGHSVEDAILMCRLARILRAGEYDFETQEVHLWAPAT